MSEPVQIVVGLICLLGVFALTRYLVGWQVKRATGFIIRDLESQNAVDPFTAVELPYAKQSPLRIGMRNYHAKALDYMVSEGVVGKTGGGKYYLQVKIPDAEPPAL
ncbi:MAG: hypothetical protein HY914_19175 [Desulfomonile tiedjei]|nr:hypothetical protein [Desulfomonile tiedjei]